MGLKETIVNTYKSNLMKRFDDEITFYYSVKDFPNLKEEAYEFDSFKGVRLRGNFYYYPNYKENHIVVFDHGMGAGYTAYFKEIEMLCKKGYKVYSYDHTGCMKSDGSNSEGFLTSLADLDSCLTNLKKDFPNHDFSVMGHSWGAFSTSNIASYHPDLKHVISLAPLNSLSSILHQTFSGLLSFVYEDIYNLEASLNPNYAESSTIKALKNYNGHALIIHSKDDKVLKVKHHFYKIQKELQESQNIEFLLVDKKGHNPNYTIEGLALLSKYLKERNKLIKQGYFTNKELIDDFNSKYDWDKITKQDESIWNEIYRVLEK